MHVTVKEIVELLEELIPTKLAENWDNVGFMVGRRDKEVKRILISLDLTKEVAAQAISMKADMLITHHPVIFSKLGNITDADWQQELLLEMIEHGIAVYSAHTNFDCVSNGVNHALACALHLKDYDILDQTNGLGRIGTVEDCELECFVAQVKHHLKASYVTYADAWKRVHRVAVCGGAGSDLIDLALRLGADTLVTGDVKYHSAQRAVFSGLNIIDAGHQPTELPAMELLADKLSLRFTDRNWDIVVKVAHEELLFKVQ